MRSLFVRLVSLALLSAAPVSPAVDTSDAFNWDLSLKSGAVVGKLTEVVRNTDGTETEFPSDYGGLPIGISLNRDILHRLSAHLNVHFILDLLSGQITRKGFDVTAAFHVWGGARRILSDYGDTSIMYRSPQSVSLLARVGFNGFSFTTDVGELLEGSVFDTMAGAEYRMDLGDRSSLALGLLYTLFSVPSSATLLKTRLLSIEASWRFFL